MKAPQCPFDAEQTEWLLLSVPGDDWSCPVCGRFGWVLPVEYAERHPDENPVQVLGINPRRIRRHSVA